MAEGEFDISEKRDHKSLSDGKTVEPLLVSNDQEEVKRKEEGRRSSVSLHGISKQRMDLINDLVYARQKARGRKDSTV